MTVREAADSPRLSIGRERTETTAEREYWVCGVKFADHAIAEAKAFAGETVDIEGQRLFLQKSEAVAVESAEDDLWRVTLTYDVVVIDLPDSFYFDTTGGTHRVEFSRETVQAEGDSLSTPNNSGRINTDKDGTVHGVNITIPQATFNFTHHFRDDEIREKYGLIRMP